MPLSDNKDLARSFDKLKKNLRKSELIKEIRYDMENLAGNSIFAEAIRSGSKTNPQITLKMIIDQYQDNPGLVIEIVGRDLLDKIEEFAGITLADDLKDVF